jgi:adenosine/AMP kinase
MHRHRKDEGTSAILWRAGFIKTVEDLYEAMASSVPGVKFGVAFAEASGPCLVRSDGNDDVLRGAGVKQHSQNRCRQYVLDSLYGSLCNKRYQQCQKRQRSSCDYCATSNPVQAIVAKVRDGRSVIGIVDGVSSRAIESESDKQSRSKLLRDLGYKRS